MRLRSFRLRIALSSALVSGAVLVLFGVVAWGLLYRIGRLGVDRDVRDLVLRQVRSGVRPGPYWRNRGNVELNASNGRAEVLLIQNPWGGVAYRSGDWPAGLTLSNLGLVDAGVEATSAPLATSARMWPLADRPLPRGPELRPGEEDASPPHVRMFTRSAGGREWRIGVAEIPRAAIVVAVGLDALARDMRDMRNAFLFALPVGLLLVAVGAVILSGRALHSVHTLSRVVEGITAVGLDQRIPPGSVDSEFDALVRVFNDMLDRLQASFGQAVRFSADAAHELKTPLTILRGRIERALAESQPDSQSERDLTELLGETFRLTSIIEALLLLSRADSGRLHIEPEAVDLREIVEDIADETRSIAPHLDIRCELNGDATTTGDSRLISMAVRNLAGNAVKYNLPEGGSVEIRLVRDGETIRLTVANTGPPIPAAQRETVFNRFHRLDPARSRGVDGVGLGLSLAREVIRAHGGDIRVEPRQGDLTRFILELPTRVDPEKAPKGPDVE